MAAYENAMGMDTMFKPLQSSHTIAGGEVGQGRPQKKEKDLSPSGSKTRATGGNGNRV
jgi:hypothetical protein